MRPEVGRVQGVAEWAEGRPFTRIVCSQGHNRRLIDRIRYVEGGRGMQLIYTAGFRLDDPLDDGNDPGTSAEVNPTTEDHKYRLACPCGLNVVLSTDSLERLAKGLCDVGVSKIELARLAAIVS